MQPTATTAWVLPWSLRSLASSRASTESFLAASTKPQVLTTATSASAASSTSSQPSAAKRPASSSESTSLRAQPRVTRATVRRSGMGSRLLRPDRTPAARFRPIRLGRTPGRRLLQDRLSRPRGRPCVYVRRSTWPGCELVLDLLAVDVELHAPGVAEDEVDLLVVLKVLDSPCLSRSVEEQPAVVVLGGDPAVAVVGGQLDRDLVLRARPRWRCPRARASGSAGLVGLRRWRGGLAGRGRGALGDLAARPVAVAAVERA